MSCYLTHELTAVETAVMDGVKSIWQVYGIKNGLWSDICYRLDSMEDIVNGLKYQTNSEEYQLLKEVGESLNFLYWNATAHMEFHDPIGNPYNIEYKRVNHEA